jgi:hypothetical protein
MMSALVNQYGSILFVNFLAKFIHVEFLCLQLSILVYSMPLASSNVPPFSTTPLIPSPNKGGVIVGPYGIRPNFPSKLGQPHNNSPYVANSNVTFQQSEKQPGLGFHYMPIQPHHVL